MSRLRRIPAWLWAAAFLPRLALFVLAWHDPARAMMPDSLSYLPLARELVRHGTFAMPSGLPETLRTPGYPLFLAPFTLLPAPWDVLSAALAQCLLGAFTALAAWLWLEPIAGRRGAGAAAGALALDLATVLHTPKIMAETAFVFLLLMGLKASWEILAPGGDAAAERLPARRPLAAGAWWGLAVTLKPIAIYWPAALSALWARRRRAAALFLAGAYLLPLLWCARNKAETGIWAFTSIGEESLLSTGAAGAKALALGGSMEDWGPKLEKSVDAAHPRGYANGAERGRAYFKAALSVLASHPLAFAAYTALGAAKTLAGTGLEMLLEWGGEKWTPNGSFHARMRGKGTLSLLRRYPALIVVEIAYLAFLALLYLAAALGLARLWRQGERARALMLLGGALYFLLISCSVGVGYYRFRIPLMPFLAVAAAFALRPSLETAQQPLQAQKSAGQDEPGGT